MNREDWAWICTCGAIMARGLEGAEAYGAVDAHVQQHYRTLAMTPVGEGRFRRLLDKIVPVRDVPPMFLYEVRLTNLQTSEVDPCESFGIVNPDYQERQSCEGLPYRIEPQHNEGPLSPASRLDRAILDVDEVGDLLRQCEPPLPATEGPEFFRQRLVRAVNLLCSAARDVDILRDELFITYAGHDGQQLRERRYCPPRSAAMFRFDDDGTPVFNDPGMCFQGPFTIQEYLQRYSKSLRDAAGAAARALLGDEQEMRAVPTRCGDTRYQEDIFEATTYSWEEESDDLRYVRSFIASHGETKSH